MGRRAAARRQVKERARWVAAHRQVDPVDLVDVDAGVSLAPVQLDERQYAGPHPPLRLGRREVAGGEAEKVSDSPEVAAEGVEVVARTRGAVYVYANTAPRVVLKDRGWTETHITRLLGRPDLELPSGLGRPEHRWGWERVQAAEVGDAKLIRRRDTYYDRQRQERQDAVDAAMEEGRVVFRKVEGQWLVQGRDLNPGQTVTVSMRDGATKDVSVVEVFQADPDDDGVGLASFTNPYVAPLYPHGDGP